MALQAPFEVYFSNESDIVLYSRRKLSHPSGVPRSATCNNMAFELNPVDLQSSDTAEWVDILRETGCVDIDTLTALNITHVVTGNKYGFVNIQQKRSQRAAGNAAPDLKEFRLGTERFIEVRTPDELEPKDPNCPPVASVFDLVEKLKEKLPKTDIGVLVSA
ncbi:hypothetical protein MKX08_010194 [Trichoderma sp. CBMAI-0020]|nr:hypothetical protein MKX08_010194 [Trichoderma sp. CBMAI-0020]